MARAVIRCAKCRFASVCFLAEDQIVKEVPCSNVGFFANAFGGKASVNFSA